MNRAKQKKQSFCDIVYAPSQFSWTNQYKKVVHDPKTNRLIVTVRRDAPPIKEPKAYNVSQAAVWLGLMLPDITNNATFYHATRVKPNWASAMTKTGQYGDHIMYKLEPHKPKKAVLIAIK